MTETVRTGLSIANQDVDEVGNATVILTKLERTRMTPPEVFIRRRASVSNERHNHGIMQAGMVTRMNPFSWNGTPIEMLLKPHPNGTNPHRSVVSQSDKSVVVRIYFELDGWRRTRLVTFDLTRNMPVVKQLALTMTNGKVESKCTQVFRKFVNCNGVPVPSEIVSVTSNPGRTGWNPPHFAWQWSSNDIGRRDPVADDFSIPIENDADVSGIVNVDQVRDAGKLTLNDAILD